MAIRAVIICVRYQIEANDDDLWQIRGSRLLEMPSCPTIPQLGIGSSTSLQKFRYVSRCHVIQHISRLPAFLGLQALSSLIPDKLSLFFRHRVDFLFYRSNKLPCQSFALYDAWFSIDSCSFQLPKSIST